MNRSKSKRGKITQLPLFINKLLEMVEDQTIQPIISWTSGGDSFSIKSVTKFTQEVLPKYFKHKNFSSFIRQLNMYGFRKIRHQQGQNVYMNEYFRVGGSHQFRNITRRIREEREDRLVINNGPRRARGQSRELSQLQSNQKNLEQLFKDMVMRNQKLMQQSQNLVKKIQNGSKEKERRMEQVLLMLISQNYNIQIENGHGQLLQISYDKPRSGLGKEETTPLQAIGYHFQRTQRYQRFRGTIDHFYTKKNGESKMDNFYPIITQNESPHIGNIEQQRDNSLNQQHVEDDYLSIHNFMDADEFQNQIDLQQSR